MVPANTYKVLGTGVAEAKRNKADAFYPVTGNDLNDLRALAMRLSYRFDNPEETRDWQNRLFVICNSATGLGELDDI